MRRTTQNKKYHQRLGIQRLKMYRFKEVKILRILFPNIRSWPSKGGVKRKDRGVVERRGKDRVGPARAVSPSITVSVMWL